MIAEPRVPLEEVLHCLDATTDLVKMLDDEVGRRWMSFGMKTQIEVVERLIDQLRRHEEEDDEPVDAAAD